MLSLRKELAHDDVHNLVIVLRHTQGLTLQQAVDRASEMLTEAVHRFEQTERTLLPFSLEREVVILKYVGNLKAWMRGNLDWSIETGRYSQVESRSHARGTNACP